jgi:hypothetical protein
MVNIPVAWNTIQAANAELSGTQNETSIIQLVNGNIVVAWVSDSTAGIAGVNPGKDVLGQIFDPLGNKLGGEFSLSNPANLVDDRMPQLAALPSGGTTLTIQNTLKQTTIFWSGSLIQMAFIRLDRVAMLL